MLLFSLVISKTTIESNMKRVYGIGKNRRVTTFTCQSFQVNYISLYLEYIYAKFEY